MSDTNSKEPEWAIRDIKHGKTYFFQDWEELTDWLLDTDDLTEVKSSDQLPFTIK